MQYLKKVWGKYKITQNDKNSRMIVPEKIVNSFIKNEDFPYLVSFPRTGSHWLRMMMELYFEKPSLRLLFFQEFYQQTEYTCLHTHDLNFDVRRNNVIYLYRNPAQTIYSQLSFHKEEIDDLIRISYWTELYAKHLTKWLINDHFSTQKTVLTYEGLKKDICSEFKKVCSHLNYSFDEERIMNISNNVKKQNIKEKTTHDPRVIQNSKQYEILRNYFISKYSKKIHEIIINYNPKLSDYL